MRYTGIFIAAVLHAHVAHLLPCRPAGRHTWPQWGQCCCSCRPGGPPPAHEGGYGHLSAKLGNMYMYIYITVVQNMPDISLSLSLSLSLSFSLSLSRSLAHTHTHTHTHPGCQVNQLCSDVDRLQWDVPSLRLQPGLHLRDWVDNVPHVIQGDYGEDKRNKRIIQ